MTALRDLGSEPFVSLTTYRRSGEAVPTPVWVVDDDGDLLVWTGAETGKVKRLRRDHRVELAPCSRRGAVAPDAPRVPGRARVSDDPADLRRAESLLRAKYGVEFLVVTTVERVLAAVRRRRSSRVVVRVSA